MLPDNRFTVPVIIIQSSFLFSEKNMLLLVSAHGAQILVGVRTIWSII